MVGADPLDVLVAAVERLKRRPAWQRDVLGGEHPEVLWFPERGEPVDAARALCGCCTVRDECLAYLGDRDRCR